MNFLEGFILSTIIVFLIYILSYHNHDLGDGSQNCDTQQDKQMLFYPNDYENARAGYQEAVTLWVNLNHDNWSRFNVMLLANTAIIGILISALKEKTNPDYSTIILLSFVGLILTILWLQLMRRDSKIQHFYASCARELEKKYLWPAVTVQNGSNLIHGKKVYAGGPFELNKFERVRSSSIIAFVVFGLMIVYLTLFLIYIDFKFGG